MEQLEVSGEPLRNESSGEYRRRMIGNNNFKSFMGNVIGQLRTRDVISNADLEDQLKILVQSTSIGHITNDIRETVLGLCLEQTMIREPGRSVKTLEYFYQIDKTPAASQRNVNNVPRKVRVDKLQKSVLVNDALCIGNSIDRQTYQEFYNIVSGRDSAWNRMLGVDTPDEKLQSQTVKNKLISFNATLNMGYKSMTDSILRGLMCGNIINISNMSPSADTLMLYDSKNGPRTKLDYLQFYMKKTNLLTFGLKKRNIMDVMNHFKITFNTNCDRVAMAGLLPEISFPGMTEAPSSVLIVTKNTADHLKSIGAIEYMDTTMTQKINEFTITRMDLAPTHHMVSDQNIKMVNGNGAFIKTEDGNILSSLTTSKRLPYVKMNKETSIVYIVNDNELDANISQTSKLTSIVEWDSMIPCGTYFKTDTVRTKGGLNPGHYHDRRKEGGLHLSNTTWYKDENGETHCLSMKNACACIKKVFTDVNDMKNVKMMFDKHVAELLSNHPNGSSALTITQQDNLRAQFVNDDIKTAFPYHTYDTTGDRISGPKRLGACNPLSLEILVDNVNKMLRDTSLLDKVVNSIDESKNATEVIRELGKFEVNENIQPYFFKIQEASEKFSPVDTDKQKYNSLKSLLDVPKDRDDDDLIIRCVYAICGIKMTSDNACVLINLDLSIGLGILWVKPEKAESDSAILCKINGYNSFFTKPEMNIVDNPSEACVNIVSSVHPARSKNCLNHASVKLNHAFPTRILSTSKPNVYNDVASVDLLSAKRYEKWVPVLIQSEINLAMFENGWSPLGRMNNLFNSDFDYYRCRIADPRSSKFTYNTFGCGIMNMNTVLYQQLINNKSFVLNKYYVPHHHLEKFKSVHVENAVRNANRMSYKDINLNADLGRVNKQDCLSDMSACAYARYCYNNAALTSEYVEKERMRPTEQPYIISERGAFLIQGSMLTDGHRIQSNSRDYF